ncbi:hypothetical protein EMCRGX_G020689 [Ephydatia muelleri]
MVVGLALVGLALAGAALLLMVGLALAGAALLLVVGLALAGAALLLVVGLALAGAALLLVVGLALARAALLLVHFTSVRTLLAFAVNELSPVSEVDLTSSHVEKVARQIQGSAGPGGTNAGHWKGFLLHYGAHSVKLRDALAELARRLANSFVEWSGIKALIF